MQELFQKNAHSEIQKIKQKLCDLEFNVTDVTSKDYNYEISVIKNKEKVKILVYFGKKGVKTLLQGDQESGLYRQLKTHLFGNELFAHNVRENDFDFEEYIGTDESGKGDYFGPLVTAGVYVDKAKSRKILELGVKDSKLLNDNTVLALEPKLKKILGENFNVVTINPEKYNDLYSSFNNLNKLLAWAHSKVIQNLVAGIDCKNVISDKFGDEKLIKSELFNKNIDLNLVQVTNGERYLAVAAASILARAKVIEWFDRNSKLLGVKIPKGGSSLATQVAGSVANQFGNEYLKKMIKFHFKNSKNIF
jgi:ribonuclease HIII